MNTLIKMMMLGMFSLSTVAVAETTIQAASSNSPVVTQSQAVKSVSKTVKKQKKSKQKPAPKAAMKNHKNRRALAKKSKNSQKSKTIAQVTPANSQSH